MTLYKNKYRSESARAEWWDYGWSASYFVTICTKERVHYFGEVENGRIVLSPVGAIADVLWYEIRNHAKNVKLDAFVVMPNHIHGILILQNDSASTIGTGEVGIGHVLSLLLRTRKHKRPAQTVSKIRVKIPCLQS